MMISDLKHGYIWVIYCESYKWLKRKGKRRRNKGFRSSSVKCNLYVPTAVVYYDSTV